MFQDIEDDHVSWLLAAAHTFLDQRKTDRAVVLLEFLGLADPTNVQGQKLLAYALLLQDDRGRCRAALDRLARCELTQRDRAAVEMLSDRLDETSLGHLPRLPDA